MPEIPTRRIKRQDLYDDTLPKGLSAPARRALIEAGCTTLTQVSQLTEAQVKRLHGIGPSSIVLLRLTLRANGLSYADEDR